MKSKNNNRIEQQHEGQEHKFLDYEYAHFHFIYSFRWDIVKYNWVDLINKLEPEKIQNWVIRPLHERVIDFRDKLLNQNYQPDLLFKEFVCENRGIIFKSCSLRLPLSSENQENEIEYEDFIVDLGYCIRIFKDGSGVVTFKVILNEENISFRNIHAVLHLVQNVDLVNDSRKNKLDDGITSSYFLNPLKYKENNKSEIIDPELIPDIEKFRLHDIFRHLIFSPPSWIPSGFKDIFKETFDIIQYDHDFQDFASPFIFSIIQVKRNSFLRFRKHPTMDTNREIATIMCKLTIDNRYIEQDYHHLSEDYIKTVLPYSHDRNILLNLCLDRRLFFSFSKRGAIAISANIHDIPSSFVVPSYLNLCEIIRARWHMGNIVNTILNRFIEELFENFRLSNSDKKLSSINILDKLFKYRSYSAAMLNDPIPHLFDGGSITEIAEIASKKLWIDELKNTISDKFELIDKLVGDYLNYQTIHKYYNKDRS